MRVKRSVALLHGCSLSRSSCIRGILCPQFAASSRVPQWCAVSHVSRVTCDVDTCLANYNCRVPSSAAGSLLQRKDYWWLWGHCTALGHIALANKGDIWPHGHWPVQDPGEMHQYWRLRRKRYTPSPWPKLHKSVDNHNINIVHPWDEGWESSRPRLGLFMREIIMCAAGRLTDSDYH